MFHIQILKNAVVRYITEQGNLVLDALIQRMLTPADNDVWLDTHTLQVFDTGLGRFGFQLLGGA